MNNNIKLNSKGFILFDGLVSFILLSSFIMFFIPFISIIQTQKYYANINLEALDTFKNSIYYYYDTKEYKVVHEENINSSLNQGIYCIDYKVKGGYDKYCKQ